MRIDAHAHGMHAEMGPDGKRVPPVMHGWQNTDIPPEEHIAEHRRRGIEKVMLLDFPHVVFPLVELFGDFILPCPQPIMDEATPEDIAAILDRGACGIKFNAPLHPYGDNRYLPLYEVVRDYHAVATFHTGYLTHAAFGPGLWIPRPDHIRMTDMRPAELDRINRALPDLKILMAHFGNPWWEEALVVMRNKNVYADLSGGCAYKRPWRMWEDLFRPNGKLSTEVVSKLCYGADDSMCHPGYFGYQPFMDFYDQLYEHLELPTEIRHRIDRENILMLTDRTQPGIS